MKNNYVLIMEFPDEIWKSFMGYFHSSYKKPLHYIGIMNCHTFYRRRAINLYWSQKLNEILQYSHSPGIFDSFYIWVVLDNWIFWEFNDVEIVKPKITFKRKVASGRVLEDFKKIWQEYASNSIDSNLLSKIKY